MRQAFARDGGPLSDEAAAEPGERVARMELFAGAIGAFKNPSSHHSVDFEDPMEAAEIIQLADLLLRIVRRAETRKMPKAKRRDTSRCKAVSSGSTRQRLLCFIAAPQERPTCASHVEGCEVRVGHPP